MSDELRDRFRDHHLGDEESEDNNSDSSSNADNTQTSDGSNETSGASNPDHPSESSVADKTSSSDDTVNVRDRPQMSMYLPPEVKERVEDDYEKLDAKSKLADQGGLRKNDDFFVGMIEFALDENREDFEDYLGIVK